MSTIEITGIRVRPLLVPLRRALTVSFGTFREVPMLAVEVETRGGVPGRVLGFGFHKLSLTLVPTVLAHLAAVAAAQPITLAAMPALHDQWQKSLMLLGHEGVTQLALSMFDMAVHDALARSAGVPLHRMLGHDAADVPSYNSCGGSLIPPREAAQEARLLATEHGGFKHVKVRLGRQDFADDLASLRAIREAVGPDVAVSVDFNQALAGHRAADTCRKLDPLGLTWIEEPVTYDDYETQARLTAKLATPVQIGETWWHWRVAKRAMDMSASDYIMPDILRIGGVTGWLRVAAIAAAAGIPMSSHLSPEFSAHVMAATPTRHWLEFMDWGQDLLLDPVVPVRGIARPGDKPGAGTDFNETALTKCLIKA